MKILRLIFVIIISNVIGYAAFRAAAWFTPQLWITAGEDISFSTRLILIAFSSILFAAPPVMMGAFAAKVAARHEIFVGLAASLWGISALQWWPNIPTLPRESWLAPMMIIFISGLMGAWLMVGIRSSRVD